MRRDPLLLLGEALIQGSIISQVKLDELDAQIGAEIDAAVQFAEESPFPAPEDALNDVYA
jgi:pyruvate dehydrogenase E1 component alpha subunit